MEREEGVSVVTTTLNESPTIEKLILLLREVLKDYPHEIIVVDDSSSDGTLALAQKAADKVITKNRQGQTACLLAGLRAARYPLIVTIDADLENPPELIPQLLKAISDHDLIVASRCTLPRISEKLTSRLLRKGIGASDIYSNFRIYRASVLPVLHVSCGETFGGELLIRARRAKCRIGELRYVPPPRRTNPRIGGKFKANARAFVALAKLLALDFSLRVRAQPASFS